MKMVDLNCDNLKISRLSFGTSRLHRLYSSKIRFNILSSVLDHGITHMDTSPYYGFGISENELGKFMKSCQGKITIATKFGIYPPFIVNQGYVKIFAGKIFGKIFPHLFKPILDWSVTRSKKSLELSLMRLGVDCVDILFLHEPQLNVFVSNELIDWLTIEKQRGTIKSWGLAGDSAFILPWVNTNNHSDMILQVRDSLENNEAGALRSIGLNPQITFGYISSSFGTNSKSNVRFTLRRALERNPNGSIIVSASSVRHIRELCSIAEEFDE